MTTHTWSFENYKLLYFSQQTAMISLFLYTFNIRKLIISLPVHKNKQDGVRLLQQEGVALK